MRRRIRLDHEFVREIHTRMPVWGTSLMEEDSIRSLASGMFSRRDSKTQTQNLTKSTSPDEFQLQLDVALLVDFLKSHVQRPLLDVRPNLQRCSLNDSP
jgi:hypothetical protein